MVRVSFRSGMVEAVGDAGLFLKPVRFDIDFYILAIAMRHDTIIFKSSDNKKGYNEFLPLSKKQFFVNENSTFSTRFKIPLISLFTVFYLLQINPGF